MRMDEIGWHSTHSSSFRNQRPDGSGDWLFLLIKTPSRICTGGSTQTMPAGTMILYTPEYPQDYGADGDLYIDDWMHFEPDAGECALIESLRIPLNTPVVLRNSTDISQMLREMCLTFYSVKPHRSEMVDLYLKMLLYRISEQIGTPEFSAERLQWIHECIVRKPFDDFRAAAFAAEMSVSLAEFEAQYLKEIGISFTDDITRSILRYGLMRMQNDDLTAEEAAQICNYVDTDEFLRLTKQYFPDGITE